MEWGESARWTLYFAFWIWVVFVGGAERLYNTWLGAFLLGHPLPAQLDPIHGFKFAGVLALLVGAVLCSDQVFDWSA